MSVLAGAGYGNKMYIEIAPKPMTVPGCHTNSRYSYVFDPTTTVGKILLNIVLTAYGANRNIYLQGTDLCSLASDVESLSQARGL